MHGFATSVKLFFISFCKLFSKPVDVAYFATYQCKLLFLKLPAVYKLPVAYEANGINYRAYCQTIISTYLTPTCAVKFGNIIVAATI
jgi:hypothetical protein